MINSVFAKINVFCIIYVHCSCVFTMNKQVSCHNGPFSKYSWIGVEMQHKPDHRHFLNAHGLYHFCCHPTNYMKTSLEILQVKSHNNELCITPGKNLCITPGQMMSSGCKTNASTDAGKACSGVFSTAWTHDEQLYTFAKHTKRRVGIVSWHVRQLRVINEWN